MSDQNRRRVVVTGLGTTSPLGGDAPTTWQATLAGHSGVRTITDQWLQDVELPVQFAAQLAVPVAQVLSVPEQKRMDPCGQMAMVAAREAFDDADTPQAQPERIAVSVGTGIGGTWTLMNATETLYTKGFRRVLPMTIPMLLPNSPAAAVSIEFSAKGGVHAPVSACASGAEAIVQMLEMIRNGQVDVALAGGTEAALHPVPIAGFAAMRALSTRNDDPQHASRPYDVHRDGFVMAEGSAILVLEEAEHAKARGAHIYAEVVGGAMTADAYHVAAPDPEGAGAARAMKLALDDARVSPTEITHINAHATSTPAGDVAEAKALHQVLGGHTAEVPVSATKSMTGHLLGAAGALESLFCALAVRDKVAPPTINITELDPEVQLDVVREQPRPLADDVVALNNSFGFGGHNASLVFRTWRG